MRNEDSIRIVFIPDSAFRIQKHSAFRIVVDRF